MNRDLQTIEFNKIIDRLVEFSYTNKAKEKFLNLEPYISETEVNLNLRETSEAREMLDKIGTPPLVTMQEVDKLIIVAEKGGMLQPEELEYLATILVSVKRLKDYLERGKTYQLPIAFYADELTDLEMVREEIRRAIRGNKVDDYASGTLKDLRKDINLTEDKMKKKADMLMRSQKECFSDSFVVNRNGHICLPVKKEYKFKISGSVIDKSSTGATLFIEPASIMEMNEELAILKLDEENEVRKILYTLTQLIGENGDVFGNNNKYIEKLDFMFAKGKLSECMDAKAPLINTERYMKIEQGRHPLLARDICVPLDFEIGKGIYGIVITGPNTGGKTVALKTVGLLSAMAQCGLHVPCKAADLCMNNLILCDIGDGQNITENLSTFSAHITNILDILKKVTNESLVILDELGSGTDPAEGMGIAIAILEQLRKTRCLFIATTHYPEVKIYTEKEQGIINARMAFDRESLRPLYEMEIGKAGESCALYIAKQLGMPQHMLEFAASKAYKNHQAESVMEGQKALEEIEFPKSPSPKLQKTKKQVSLSTNVDKFNIGDSVMVFPEKKIGIICKKVNEEGEAQIQLKQKKIMVNHKRLKLQVAATCLYPENYDFSIVFDSVAVRKARHQMERKYCENLEITENMQK